MLLKSCLALVLASTLFFACDTKQNIDREAFKKEMKSREIRRLTDSEILLEAERVGGLIAASKGEELSQFTATYNLKIDTIGWKETVQDSTVSSIVDVYRYANESGQEVSKGIQASTDKLLYYCIPYIDSTGTQGVTIFTMPKKELIMNLPED